MILRNTDEDDLFNPKKLTEYDPTFYGILPQQKKRHQCTIFGAFTPGKVLNVGHIPLFRVETSKVDDFLGRTTEMHLVINYIHTKRVVNVMGIPGIGKTTLIKAVAHYLDERIIMRDGIIWLSLRGLESASMILTRLELIIGKKIKDFIAAPSNNNEASNNDDKILDKKVLLEKITNFLKDQCILMIFDNAETPSRKDPKNFSEVI